MGWLIALGVVVLLGFLPIGIKAKYDQAGFLVQVLFGVLSVRVYPGKKGSKEKKQQQSLSKQSRADNSSSKGGSAKDFFPLVQRILDFLKDFKRRLKVNYLQLHVVLAEEDPCDLANHYADANAFIAVLLPLLEENFQIKKRDIHIGCDFAGENTLVTAKIILSLSLYRLISMGLHHGYHILKDLRNILKTRKGGATK